MEIREELNYVKSHEWVKEEGEIVTIGLTDYAQSELGDLVFVNQADSSGTLADARALAELLERPVVAGSLWRGEYVPCWS